MEFITKEEDKEIELFCLFSELINSNYLPVNYLVNHIGLDINTINDLLYKSIIPEDSFFCKIEDHCCCKFFDCINNPKFPNGEFII